MPPRLEATSPTGGTALIVAAEPGHVVPSPKKSRWMGSDAAVALATTSIARNTAWSTLDIDRQLAKATGPAAPNGPIWGP